MTIITTHAISWTEEPGRLTATCTCGWSESIRFGPSTELRAGDGLKRDADEHLEAA